MGVRPLEATTPKERLKETTEDTQTCEHVAVELLQFERVIMKLLDHFSRIPNATSHFPEKRFFFLASVITLQAKTNIA